MFVTGLVQKDASPMGLEPRRSLISASITWISNQLGCLYLAMRGATGERNIRREDDPCEGSSFIHRSPFHSSSVFYCSDPVYRNAQEHATHKTPKEGRVFYCERA